ncbi:hypothetical protein FKM82_013260 [Ascaphus truei]
MQHLFFLLFKTGQSTRAVPVDYFPWAPSIARVSECESHQCVGLLGVCCPPLDDVRCSAFLSTYTTVWKKKTHCGTPVLNKK